MCCSSRFTCTTRNIPSTPTLVPATHQTRRGHETEEDSQTYSIYLSMEAPIARPSDERSSRRCSPSRTSHPISSSSPQVCNRSLEPINVIFCNLVRLDPCTSLHIGVSSSPSPLPQHSLRLVFRTPGFDAHRDDPLGGATSHGVSAEVPFTFACTGGSVIDVDQL